MFLGAPTYLYNWLCPLVGWFVCNAFVWRSTRRTLLGLVKYLPISVISNVSLSQWFSMSPYLSHFQCLLISVIFNVSPWWFVRLFVGLCVSSLIGSSICHILFWFKVFHCVNRIWTMGASIVRDNRVFNRPLGRLLGPLTRSLAHSLCSFPHETVEIHEYVFTLKTRSTGTNAFLVITRNTPYVQLAQQRP